MNKASERYNTKVEIPISIILETIFSDDNHDVETLCRWAKHYEFIDLIKENENDKLGYYKLQDDYTKQSFYIWLDKEERKQYDYEDYLLDKIDKYKNVIDKIKEFCKDKIQEQKEMVDFSKYYLENYDKAISETNSSHSGILLETIKSTTIKRYEDILELLEKVE